MKKTNKSGVTLITLMVMISIMFTLVSLITFSVTTTIQNSKKIIYATELINVQSIVDEYINKDMPVPIKRTTTFNLNNVKPNIISEQFASEIITSKKIMLDVIDLQEIGITKTKYGNENTENDLYVLSALTNKVYYMEGVPIGSKRYFTLTKDLTDYVTKHSEMDYDKDAVVFEPSSNTWTNIGISVVVKVPEKYTITSIVSNKSNTSTITQNGYKITTVNSAKLAGNYSINVTYVDAGKTKTAVYSIDKFDSTAPVISPIQKIINKNESMQETEAYLLDVKATDDISGIKFIKYEKGSINASEAKQYFSSYGEYVNGSKIKIEPDTPTYTIYVEDKAGNMAISVVNSAY